MYRFWKPALTVSALVLLVVLAFPASVLADREAELKKSWDSFVRLMYDTDFSRIDSYEELRDIQKEMFAKLNYLTAENCSVTLEQWVLYGSEIEDKLARRAKELGNRHAAKVVGMTSEGRENAFQAARYWLLAAQARRWKGFTRHAWELTPDYVEYDENIAPGKVIKNKAEKTWTVTAKKDTKLEVTIHQPVYQNVWKETVSDILRVARKARDVQLIADLAGWLKEYEKPMIDEVGNTRVYKLSYKSSKHGAELKITLKQMPDTERRELAEVRRLIEEERRSTEGELQRWIDEHCKKMGNEPSIEGMTEELRCIDLGY